MSKTLAAFGPFIKGEFLHHELGENPRFIQRDTAEIVGRMVPVEVYEVKDSDFETFKQSKMKNNYRLKKLKLSSGIVAYVLWHNITAR